MNDDLYRQVHGIETITRRNLQEWDWSEEGVGVAEVVVEERRGEVDANGRTADMYDTLITPTYSFCSKTSHICTAMSRATFTWASS